MPQILGDSAGAIQMVVDKEFEWKGMFKLVPEMIEGRPGFRLTVFCEELIIPRQKPVMKGEYLVTGQFRCRLGGTVHYFDPPQVIA